MQIIIGKASPTAEHAYAQIGQHTADRPGHRLRSDCLRTQKGLFYFIIHAISGWARLSERTDSSTWAGWHPNSYHNMGLSARPYNCQNDFQHQIDNVDDEQRLLPLPMRVR